MESLEQIRSEIGKFLLGDYFRKLKYIEDNVDISSNAPIRIAVLRSYTLEIIEPMLKLRLILDGYNPEFFWGDFNQYSQEILDESSQLYEFKPSLVLLMLRLEELMPSFVYDFVAKSTKEWFDDMNKTVEHIVTLVETLNSMTAASVLVQNMSMFSAPYWGIYDAQLADNQMGIINSFNKQLSREFEDNTSTYIWDFNSFVTRKGIDSIFDPKLWYISSNPFKQSAYAEISHDIMRYISSMSGNLKKCIVVDLDNTLWGGILGEEGKEGIALSHDYPGNCYMAFQKELLKLYNRGIILAINSKNNEVDAFDVIDNHPYMVLRREHFAAVQINWNNKADNLRALADSLNIGMDSMLMIDDNPVECSLVRQLCPECSVLQFPNRPYLLHDFIRKLPGIENIKMTDEDRRKGKIYTAQRERKKFKDNSSTLEDFLKSLSMEVEIKPADKFSIPRIAQLTQKTNQFNLTTKRYSEVDITKFTESSKSHIFSVSAKDRFGDNGIIGVCILKFDNDICRIDSFLLSCRVIGRTIEQSVIAFICDFARQRGAKSLLGKFIPTAKNKQVKGVYERFNFRKLRNGEFILDLKQQRVDYSSYISHKIDCLKS